MRDHPSYLRVFGTFARNSLVRDMTFRANFLIDVVTSLGWMSLNLAYYVMIYQYTKQIGGWSEFQFFIFIATTVLVNSVVQAFFMPNADEFSELIRTGALDFALLKPIDTQFLISLRKIEWSSLSNFLLAIGLLGYSLVQIEHRPTLLQWILYPLYVGCGVAMLYSLMIVMASISVWLGRNQSLYDFWFYITTFSRYPMEIYQGPIGLPLRRVFTWIIPVLIVVNVPARLLAKTLEAQYWPLAIFALVATVACLLGSRLIFQAALGSYRSASS